MEEILKKLLLPDNEKIQEGTIELREAFKEPESTPALYRIAISSPNPEMRQYAAVLLRKRYSKWKNWLALPEHIRNEFKAVMLQALVNEQEKSVKNAIVQLIGIIIKHELPKNGWPQALQFIQQLITSDNMAEKELGMYTLSIITEIASEAYLPTSQAIMTILSQTLNNLQDLANSVAYYIIKTMLNFVPYVSQKQHMVNAYHEMMPRMLNTIVALSESHEEKAIECYELFEELCDNAVTVISPHLKNVIAMSLTIAQNKSLGSELRVKAIAVVGCLVRTKKKAIVKNKLVEPIIDTLFALISSRPDDEEEEIYFNGDDEDKSPMTCATQTLDALALYLPPDKLIPHLLLHIEPGLEGTDIYKKKAAYLAMAVLAEGCSEYIRTSYLETFVRCICSGIVDPTPVVRNAALFALGQFSEFLQPDISNYATELLPIFFEYLAQICNFIKQEKKEPPAVDRMFYALEMFCENLNVSLLPYLPNLMERLFESLDHQSPVHVRELALSAIGAAANASKENMVPYLERILAILNPYLIEKQTEETMCLQIQAVDTLGVLVRTVGENIKDNSSTALAVKSLECGMTLLKECNDPDLRKSVYGLAASASMVMKKDMNFALSPIVDQIINSIKSSEGVVTHYKENEEAAFPVYEPCLQNSDSDGEEDIENTDNEDDDDDEDIAGFSVENAYVEEKEEAILALKEIAQNTEEVFLPFLEVSYNEVFKVISYPQDDIRKAAIEALGQFAINFSRINTIEGKEATQKVLSALIPKFSEIIRLDCERSVVISALDELTEVLKEIKTDVLIIEGHKEAIMNCITEILAGRTYCQDQEEADEEDMEAEQDELLIECAGDLLTHFGRLLSPEEFAHFFQTLLAFILERLKKNKTEAQRSFAVGTISECFSGLKQAVAPFVQQIMPLLLELTSDSNAEVRNNAIYGIGEIAYHGKDVIFSYYPNILQTLSNGIQNESHAGARDNVVGAIARLISTNYSILPLDQVFPVFINQLPLKEDVEENKAVFESILTLYKAGHEILKPHITTLINVSSSLLSDKKYNNDETRNLVVEFLNSVRRDFQSEYQMVLGDQTPDILINQQATFSP
ncbi:importin-4-like [Leptopilina heterotoma]|uniref:importin-4-like n=1 Tax=Leptopilina heterotoma TaxID=63436 RepID=UPI001CA9D1AF|nr:importin-4-like [Leptopilina heterotoma]